MTDTPISVTGADVPGDVVCNVEDILRRMTRAARASGREPGVTHLMAVTKNQSVEKICEALAAGISLFGENRVQEAQAHWAGLKEKNAGIRLHLIGPLQTNKVRDAVALFDCIETLDREKLALALAAECKTQGKATQCLIQVNTGEEPQKAGVFPSDLTAFHAFCRDDCGLVVKGLMCIPPEDDPAALHFALLKTLAKEEGLSVLSMGMSGDFEKAVALGSSHIRVGSALFGTRSESV